MFSPQFAQVGASSSASRLGCVSRRCIVRAAAGDDGCQDRCLLHFPRLPPPASFSGDPCFAARLLGGFTAASPISGMSERLQQQNQRFRHQQSMQRLHRPKKLTHPWQQQQGPQHQRQQGQQHMLQQCTYLQQQQQHAYFQQRAQWHPRCFLRDCEGMLWQARHRRPPPAPQLQRRWYTPPSRRNWSKQHSKIFTQRPLTDNFALSRLHPELEWFRERASQPVSLFMGFPDLEKLHVRGGASYINEMDASTLSIVLTAISSQGRMGTASPPHLLQHNTPLIEQMGVRAAALAATAPDPTLAYLFRGCAAAGVSDWASICTLVGHIDTRLPRFSVHDILVLLQGVRLARAGTLRHFADDLDASLIPLSPVYIHPPFVDRVVRQLELLLQHRNDVLPAELCAAATLLAGLGYASAVRMKFLSSLLAQVPQQQLALTPPKSLAGAMEVFAACRAELNEDAGNFFAENWIALPPLLRAAAVPAGLKPSYLLLTLLFLVAPLLHRLQRVARPAGGGALSPTALREGGNGSRRRSCRAGNASPTANAGGLSASAGAFEALSDAAASAAAAAVEEQTEVRRQGSLLRHAVRICLEWAYERREDLSVHSISKILYAATSARIYPSGPSFFEDLVRASMEQLDECTPADLARLFCALLRAGDPRPSADPILRQARRKKKHQHLSSTSRIGGSDGENCTICGEGLGFDMRDLLSEHSGCCSCAHVCQAAVTGSQSLLHSTAIQQQSLPHYQERIQHALSAALEACGPSALVRVHTAIAEALEGGMLHAAKPAVQQISLSPHSFATADEKEASVRLLAQKAARCFSIKLTRARSGELVSFLMSLKFMLPESDDAVARQILEILLPRLQLLEPAQMANLLAVVSVLPQDDGIIERDLTRKLLASLNVRLKKHQQQWHPEICLRTILSLSRLSQEHNDMVHPLAVAICDMLVDVGRFSTTEGPKDIHQVSTDVSCESVSRDKYSGGLAAILDARTPSNERSIPHSGTSPLQWLSIGEYKQLLLAVEELRIRHTQLRLILTQAVAMKR